MFHNSANILLEYLALPREPRAANLFQVSGFPHYEQTASNILAFLINPSEAHGLGQLLLESIANLVNIETSQLLRDVKVEREVVTTNGKFIDILITTQTHVVCIENKIDAPLKNDLSEYWSHSASLANGKSVIGIVLSPLRRSLPDGCNFKSITYEELWSEVKKRIGLYIQGANSKWIHYLIDFMDNTESNASKFQIFTIQEEFLITNWKSVETIKTDYEALEAKLNDRIKQLKQIVSESKQFPSCINKLAISEKCCLSMEYSIQEYRAKVFLYIDVTGWHLQVEPKDTRMNETFLRFATQLGCSPDGPRFFVPSWSLKSSLADIAEKLLDWVGRLPKDLPEQ